MINAITENYIYKHWDVEDKHYSPRKQLALQL